MKATLFLIWDGNTDFSILAFPFFFFCSLGIGILSASVSCVSINIQPWLEMPTHPPKMDILLFCRISKGSIIFFRRNVHINFLITKYYME